MRSLIFRRFPYFSRTLLCLAFVNLCSFSLLALPLFAQSPNPVPTLGGLNPYGIVKGGPGVTLTAYGTGFVSGSIIQWNGQPLLTSLVSDPPLAPHLVASVNSALTANLGTATITVVNSAPGGGLSNPQTFSIIAPLQTPTLIALNPTQVTVGGSDFTLVVTGTGFDSTSTVYLNVYPYSQFGLPPTVVSPTQITVRIPADALRFVQTLRVEVDNVFPDVSAIQSNTLNLTVAAAAPSHLLWTHTSGMASVWNLSDPNPAATCSLYGPFAGWTAQAIAQGPDGHGRLLWTHTDGRAALWNLADPSPAATCKLYGPYTGWTATALTVGPYNAAHLLWDNADGRVALWNTTDADPTATCTIAGPYAGWSGVAIGLGSNNQERLLWDNVSGQASVWNLSDANPSASCVLYGPYSGWTAKRLSVGSDNAGHLLWDNVSGEVSLWNLSDTNPAATCVLAGPYSGWSGQDLSVGGDNKGRLLWDNVSGQVSLWNLADTTPSATYTLAGPYGGWTAVSLAAGT